MMVATRTSPIGCLALYIAAFILGIGDTEARRNDADLNRSQQHRVQVQLNASLQHFAAYDSVVNMKDSEKFNVYFKDIDNIQGRLSISEAGLIGLYVKLKSAFYSDFFIHKYDDFDELMASGGPDANQELCLQHLNHLIERKDRLENECSNSRDLNLYQLFDTYGRVPPGLMLGSTFWPGMYSECLRIKIDMPEGKVGTRYCLVALKHKFWPNDPISSMLVFKAGICLPRSCDSSNYKNKFELVADLVDYHARAIEKSDALLTELYCLPDEQSSVRQWWRKPDILAIVLALVGWLALLAFATYKYERITRSKGVDAKLIAGRSKFGFSNGLKIGRRRVTKENDRNQDNVSAEQQVVKEIQSDIAEREECTQKTQTGDSIYKDEPYFRIYKVLAATNNFNLLFSTDKASSLMEAGAQAEGTSEQPSESFVDIRVIEGIKVLSTFYVIMGHVLMCSTIHLNNPREMATTKSFVFALVNLMPAFLVNSFFCITGLLTSYLIFKQNKSHSFITNPVKWLAFFIYRYLRIMPMYVLVVLYLKKLAKYTGSGPMWDYGTTALGQRRACELESWWPVWLFTANFLENPLQHCIPAAWYLANDFQFFLVTPIFLVALYKNPTFGKRLLEACTLIGIIIGIFGILLAETEDLTPIANFSPQGFRIYVSNLTFSYTRPHHRIPAYLIGLYIGYMLFCYEQDQIKFKASQSRPKSSDSKATAKNEGDENGNTNSKEVDTQRPDWSEAFKKYCTPIGALFILGCFATPSIGSRIPFTPFWAKVAVALYMPIFHVSISTIVGSYTLLATTGYGNKSLDHFLSASFWKPPARLSLCVVLINIEVISYYMQTSFFVHYLDPSYHIILNLISIGLTYLVATVVCVLFEAPIRGALNQVLALVLAKVAKKKKKRRD